MTDSVTTVNWKKFLGQMLAGGAVGAGLMAAVLCFGDGLGLDSAEPAQIAAFAAGMIYGVMGLMVGILALVPKAGARILNVDDADELRDQQPVILISAAACVAIALFFLILAAATNGGDGGLVDRDVALAVAAVSLVAIIVMTRRMTRMTDELTQKISTESSALAMHATMILFGGWAALAHLGYAQWVDPLAFIASLALLQLVVVFWVAARRGMVVVPEQTQPKA